MKNKKKIFFFSPIIDDGGVKKNFILVINRLIKKYEITLITSADKEKLKKLDNKIKIFQPSINYFIIYPRILKKIFCFLLGLSIVKKNNLIISFESNIMAIIISKLKNAKVITRSNAAPQRYINNFIKLLIFKFFFKKSNQVIVNSAEFKKIIDKKFGISSMVIYNSIEKRNVNFKKKISLKKYFKIISIGRLVPEKDHLTLLKAIKLVKNKINVKLLILGKGNLKNKLYSYCVNNNLRNYVHFLGFKKDIYKYLKFSDCLVLSSTNEGQPNVLIEAIAMKKIIISSDCPTGPKEMLLNGRAGYLFPVGNYKKLAQKILYCSKNKKENFVKVNKAYKTLHKYDIAKNIDKYQKIIERLI